MEHQHRFEVIDNVSKEPLGCFLVDQTLDGLVISKYDGKELESTILYLEPPDNWLVLLNKWTMPLGSFEYVLNKICPKNKILQYKRLCSEVAV